MISDAALKRASRALHQSAIVKSAIVNQQIRNPPSAIRDQ
jgi:hypothetical protein